MTYAVWDQFGASILQRPELTLAAYLGAPWAVARAGAAGIAVPSAADFKRDPAFDPNPHHLALPDDYLQTMFHVRTLATWGWRPLVDLAVVCSEDQLRIASPMDDDGANRARIAAASAAKSFQADPNARNRAAARRAAEACAACYSPFESDPDSPNARTMWFYLGACWFAAETAAQDASLTQWDGPGPDAASATWRTRNAVWPQRAAEAAAEASSYPSVRNCIRDELIARCRAAVDA